MILTCSCLFGGDYNRGHGEPEVRFLIVIFAFKVVQLPAVQPFFFDLMLWVFIGMLALHAYGTLRKTQPYTETLEIILWVVLSLLTLGFYPS
jgi:hypothetical protein